MLEGILNAGNQGIQDAPAPMAPVNQQQEAPGQNVNFDVEQNPQDRQFMTDAMMYAPMLKNMDPEQRKEKWPDMVNAMSQVSPKASAIFDPTLPPSDKDLDALMARMPGGENNQPKPQENIQLASARDDYNQAMVKRQLEGKAPISQIEWNAEQEKKKTDEDAKNDPYSQANMQYKDLSNDEFIFKATMAAGKGSKFMTADAGNVMSDGAPPSLDDGDDPAYKGVKPGYKWKDPNNKSLGVEEIPGYAKTGASANVTKPAAGNKVMVELAQASLPTIKSTLFNEDGGINYKNIGYAQAGSTISGLANQPKAQQLATALEVVVQAATRSETGAAMPADEVNNARKRYQPAYTDTQEVVLQKYFNMKFFANRYVELTQPTDDPKVLKFDTAKADAVEAKLQLRVQNYKEKWMKEALANPENQKNGVTPDDLNKAWNLKLLNDDKFVAKMGEEMQKDLKIKKGE